jgi:hypothetical protein
MSRSRALGFVEFKKTTISLPSHQPESTPKYTRCLGHADRPDLGAARESGPMVWPEAFLSDRFNKPMRFGSPGLVFQAQRQLHGKETYR